MLVEVKNLKSNPYRDMEHYPIDKDKIQSLKDSIEQTEFWDNILARKNGKEYQIAYGHHRLQALQELGIEEVDIPVKELDDATMIQIMANENMEQWKINHAVINETVKVARDFLNAELAKYDWHELQNHSVLINLLDQKTEKSFNKVKAGVGQTTILKFLGKGWKQWMIQDALDTLKDNEIDQKAVETFKSPAVAREFKKAVRNINKETPQKITKEETIELAEKVQKRISDNKGKGLGEKSYASTMKTIIRQEIEEVDEYSATLKDLILEIESIINGTKNLKNKIESFNGKLLKMEIKDLKGIQSLFVVNEFSLLLEAINAMVNYFGADFNNLKKQ